MTRYRAHVGRQLPKAVAAIVTFGLVAAACGGGSGTATSTNNGPATTQGASGQVDESSLTPVSGGSATMALEADTTGGWCLVEAQLAAAGIQVARAIYDTLMVPDDKGGYQGSLATSVTPNADFKTWTIKLRSGIKFHDGTALDATVVKNNLDAYRGAYTKKKANGDNLRNPLLFIFVFSNIKDVQAAGTDTVVVNMNKPWSTFPSHLYQYGRLGIMAQAQLDSPDHCFDKMIGTGPFMFNGDWTPNNHLTVVKNPNYWRKDKNGKQLPYLDKLTFKTVLETSSLIAGMRSGSLDLAVTDNTLAIKPFQDDAKSNKLKILATDKDTEINYTILNEKTEPFNNINARKAFAYAFNRDQYNVERQNGLLQKASGPFAPGVLGYLPASETKLPDYNLAMAKTYVKKYETETGQKLKFQYGAPNDSDSQKSALVVKGFMQAAGMDVSVRQADQSQYINDAISGNFQAQGWRNHPGFDPDDQYVWWHCDAPAPATQPSTFPAANACDNLVNFSKFNDAVINKNLDDGRTTTDPTARKTAYENINKEFAAQLWELWGYYALWSVPSSLQMHGIANLALPTATSVNAVGEKPFEGLSSGVDPAGLWKSK